MEKDIKYIILEKHNILNKIKYRIGKRYKLNESSSVEIYENISDINFLNYSFKWLIEDIDVYEIETYQTLEKINIYEGIINRILCTSDFKILKKINYKEMNIEKENSEIIFGFKNRDEKILDKILQFAKEDCYKAGFQLASLRIEKYLKELRKTDDFEVIYGLLNLGRNEDLDRFIKYENKDVLCKISNIERPKDLDVLINCVDVNVVNNVLKNRRKKDINKYIENPLFTGLIINVEFDWFLDEIMNNSKIEKNTICF